jgi:hypothetical protein
LSPLWAVFYRTRDIAPELGSVDLTGRRIGAARRQLLVGESGHTWISVRPTGTMTGHTLISVHPTGKTRSHTWISEWDRIFKTPMATPANPLPLESFLLWRGRLAAPSRGGLAEVRLDGLLRIVDLAPLAALPLPWSAVGQADELVIEIERVGDHLDLLALDRALRRRLVRQMTPREDPDAPR